MRYEQILEIVINKLRSLVDTFPEEQKITVNENTMLFGNGSSIDSLSLVSLIVDIEMYFSDELNIDISLTDDRAMTRAVSPFESVASLVDYIFEILNEKQNN